jgi:hypothetical protein
MAIGSISSSRLVGGAVVELGGAWRSAFGEGLRVFERAAVLKVGGDADAAARAQITE